MDPSQVSSSLKEWLPDSKLSSLKSAEDLESLRQDLRSLAKENLFFLSKAVLNYPKLTTHLHQEMTEVLQRVSCPRHPDKCRRKMIILPRGHLKTTICTKSYPIWRYLRNPEIRILLANERAENASHFVREIKGHFESNEFFQWLFPEAIPDFGKTKWTESEIHLPRSGNYSEGTVETIGVGGTVVSRHYDLVILDDLVGLEAANSSEKMSQAIEWYKYAVGLMVSPKDSEVLYVGTRWGFADLINHIEENEPSFDVITRSVLEDGEPIWPEEFTSNVIDEILDSQGPKIFSCQYMNDPTHENPASFDFDWLRYYVVIPTVLRKATAMDPAIGQTAQSDYTAITTLGMDADRNIYLLDLTRERLGVDELIEELFRHYLTWQPRTVGIETVFFQKALLWPIREAMRRHELTLPVYEIKHTDRRTKVARISAMHPYFARGQFWLPKTGVAPFLKEFREFPVGAHDDALDATAMCLQLLTAPSGLEVPYDDPLSYDGIKRELLEKQMNRGQELWAYHKEVRA